MPSRHNKHRKSKSLLDFNTLDNLTNASNDGLQGPFRRAAGSH